MQKSTNDKKLALAFVIANAVVWWLLFSAGRASLDTYGDMAEAYAWGISWQWGYDKHPPLSAWTAAAWFQVFPTRDWAFYLLAMVNQAVAFWFLFLAGRRWLPGSQALLAVMLTSLIPLFGADTGFKFNANSAMLPWLAMFAWSLIVALQTGLRRYLVVAGVAAGAACLVKYWAPLMLVSTLCGTLMMSGRSMTLSWRTTPLRLLTISGISTLCLAPHLSWAVGHHWPSLRYAHEAHSLAGGSQLGALLELFLDLSLVAVIPVVAWLLSMAYARATHPLALRTEVAPTDTRRRNARMMIGGSIFALAVLLTLVSAQLVHVSVASKWLIPAWLFFGWFLCNALPVKFDARRLIRPLGALIVLYWAGLLAYTAHINPSFDITRDATNQRRTVANETTSEFRALFQQPLAYVAGSPALIFSTSFYSDDHPLAIPSVDFDRASWVDGDDVKSKGLAVLCEASDTTCVNTAKDELGEPFKTQTWSGRTDTGEPTTVFELYYPPQTP